MFDPSPVSPRTDTRVALAVGIVCAAGYLAVGVLQAVVFGPSFSGGNYAVLFLASLVMVAVPIALWLRYRLIAPLAAMGLLVIVWQVVVPVFGSEGDGTPVFALALAFTPVYVVGYVSLGAVEGLVRRMR